MEVLVGLSLALAGIVGGLGLIVVYRRRQAGQTRLRSDELRALDERIAARVAGLRPDGEGPAEPRPSWPDDEVAELATPMPALLPVEGERSWRRRLGFGGGGAEADRRSEGGTVLRDTAVVLGAGVVVLVVASQLFSASSPSPNATPTPSTTALTELLPTGTFNFLVATPSPTLAPGETPTPTLDITYEPTPTPRPPLSGNRPGASP